MKTTIKILQILALVFLCVSCEKDPDPADYRRPSISLNPATGITASSAQITGKVTIRNVESTSIVMEGFANGNSMGREVESLNKGTTEYDLTYTLSNLVPGTKYEFYIVLSNGNYSVNSSSITFTTKSVSVSLTVPTATLTKKEYSSSGFIFDGYTYHYRYSADYSWYLTGSASCSSTGIMFGDSSSFGTTDPSYDGKYTRSIYHYSNSSSISGTCKSYAKLKTGTWKYSSQRSYNYYYTKASESYEEDSENHCVSSDICIDADDVVVLWSLEGGSECGR